MQAVASWRQGTAERYEILIDFRKYKVGQTVDLRNLSNKNNIDFANTDKIMRFQVVADSGPGLHHHRIPTTLDDGRRRQRGQGRHRHDEPDPGDGRGEAPAQVRAPERPVDHQRGHLGGRGERPGSPSCSRNPQPFDVEQWTIVNESGGWFHPVHIHLIDAKIIARNTNGGKPFAWERGPKDVFYAGENESVTALMQFDTGSRNGERPVHDPLPQPGPRGPRHDGAVLRRATPDDNDPITSDPPVLDTTPLDSFPPVYRPGSRPGPEMSRARPARRGGCCWRSPWAGCSAPGHARSPTAGPPPPGAALSAGGGSEAGPTSATAARR